MITGKLSLISAAVMMAAACCCLGVWAAIRARLARDSEVTVLLLLLVALGCHYLCWGARDLLDGIPGISTPQARYVLNGAGEICRIIFFALIGHFFALLLRRLVDPFEEAITADTLRVLQYYPPLIANRQLGFWMVIVTSYGAALCLLLPYAYYFLRPLRAGWPVESMPDPSVPLGDYYWFFMGLGFGLYPGILVVILTALFQRLPAAQQRARRFARWMFVNAPADGMMRLELAGARPDSTTSQAQVAVNEWRAFVTLAVGSVIYLLAYIVVITSDTVGYATKSLVGLSMALMQLFILLPITYYKSRLLFFDVLIKKGVLWAALLFSGVVYFAGLLPQLTRAVRGEAPGGEALLLCVSGLLFAAGWVACHGRFERALDHHLFHRPDYARLILEINREMRRHAEPHPLIRDLIARLKEGLGAAYVRYEDLTTQGELDMSTWGPDGHPSDDSSEMAAIVSVSNDARQWGRLLFGGRRRGQTYQSEDLSFLLTVGNQLADMLDNFTRRDERQKQALRERELSELSLRSELKTLRDQINPHFLFNALGTLAHLTRNDPRAAERTIYDLAEAFRFAINTSREESVTLGAEIDFLTAYLAVERARFGERLRYEFRVPEVLRRIPIPPMLIQPLVENAIRHGITPRPGGGLVTVSAVLREDWLTVTVTDDGVGFDPERRLRTSPVGVGLANVRERVGLLFGPGRWRLSSTLARGTTAELEIQVNRAAECAPPPSA